jgi:uncharacterized caspase-like protein
MTRSVLLRVVAALLAAVLGPAAAAQDHGLARSAETSERRVALMVGNNVYRSMALTNAVNDARAVHAVLSQLGFESTLVVDASFRDLSPPAAASRQDRRLSRPDAASGRRVALVIGNQAYPRMALKNAAQDARDVHAVLGEVGFDTDLVIDATKRQMDMAIGRFIDKLQPDDVAVVYYAGHGTQIAGENYLLPIDVETADEASMRHSSYSASLLHDRIADRGARLKILILDACRDNPFRMSRSAAQGLAPMAAVGRGTFIAFATGPGSTADDNGSGRNGLFTAALLEALREPGLDLSQLFDRVRQRVDAVSNGRQTPWSNSSVVGQFFFRAATVVAAPPPAAAPSVPDVDLARREELAFWEGIKDSGSPRVFEDYLKRYGENGRFSAPAHEKLEALRRPPPANPSLPQSSTQPPGAIISGILGGTPPPNTAPAPAAGTGFVAEVTQSRARFIMPIYPRAVWDWNRPSTPLNGSDYLFTAEVENGGARYEFGYYHYKYTTASGSGGFRALMRAGQRSVFRVDGTTGSLMKADVDVTLEDNRVIIEVTDRATWHLLFGQHPTEAVLTAVIPGAERISRRVAIVYK